MKQTILDGIFPPRCVLCKKVIGRKKYVCQDCVKKFKYIEEPKCKICGKQLHNQEDEYCYDCQRHAHVYKQGFAVFQYSDGLKDTVYSFKYNNNREIGEFYGREMYLRYGDIFKKIGIDLILPVPLHKSKRQRRGFNQAELIARALSGRCKIPYRKDVIARTRRTIPQKELNNIERKKNLREAFAVKNKKALAGVENILLIDDIYTTGSTIDECAKVLREASDVTVYFASASIGLGI